jgi:hypothetical protein
MALGPLSTYVSPGVYSRTLSESNLSSLVGGLRIPTLLGVGQEELEQLDYELVRGSSSTLDQQIVNEDVSESWVVDATNASNPTLGATNGSLLSFRVKNLPLVDGQGFGRVTNDVRAVSVTVNGTPVAVGSVRGSTGIVTLQVPPSASDVVRVTYFFHRGDTAFMDDVSDQVTNEVAKIVTPGAAPFDVVAGTSDTLKLKVNGGSEKTITFVPSPAIAAQVSIAGSDLNGNVTYKAVTAGADGNDIRVRHVVAGTGTALSVVVSTLDITVNVATDGFGSATSTANDIAAAIAASTPASALVTATASGSGASVTMAASYTNLAGGIDGGPALALKSQIDAAAITGLTTVVFTANDGTDHLQLTADVSIEIGAGNANGILGLASGQKTARNATFQVFQRPIVDGSSGGITTTDPSKVVVKVSGVQVIPVSVDGKNGLVTLANPPQMGSTVTVSYYANTWQDTFDYLPNTLVTNVLRAGISPNRSDYIEGQDFVVSNPSADVSVIHWGASYSVASQSTTAGAELFDDSQIRLTLSDDKLYLATCQRYTNTAVVPAVKSSNEFLLPQVPTTGNGRDTPLGAATYSSVANSRQDLASNRPDLITVRVGRTLSDALGRPAAKVTAVDAATRKITLRDPVPADWNAYATFWYSRLADDSFTLTCKTPGAVGSGQYEVFSSLLNDNLYQVRFKQKGGGLAETVQWPRGAETVPDAFHYGGTPVSETVTVTFSQSAATNAIFTSQAAGPWSFYSPSSATWRTDINAAGTLSTNLATATRAYLVSQKVAVSGGNVTIGSGQTALELTIDGVNVSVTLSPGATSLASLASTINTAIDATAEFAGTAPNYLFTALPSGSTGAYFVLRSYSTPASLPGGFDHKAKVQIRPGTAESALGFSTFQSASGTPTAVNKPATLLGSVAGPFVWSAGVNDVLKLRLNGVDYSITISASSTAASDVVTDINAVLPSSQGAASVGTLDNVGKIRITSATNGEQSSIVILNGTANSVLGFTAGDFASQTKVGVDEVAARLMATLNFAVTSWTGSPAANASGAVAYAAKIDGQNYLRIESFVAGSNSSIAFVAGSNSAFNTTTGTKIVPGTDGDSGEDAADMFTVTSTNGDGSSGTGVPGQTYTDEATGLRFTVLPSTTGSYTSGGWFQLDVSPTFNVSPSSPSYAIPGAEMVVSNTVNVGLNDTAVVKTFNPSGLEPAVGDFYFLSYRYMKQDFSTRIFRQFKTIEANYGKLSAENRVTLGAYLAILNGAVLIGIKQVLKVPNTNQASAASFIEAIEDLATPLPGNIKPDILVPLATDTSVYSYLTQHCEIQSNIRNRSERMGFIGFASGTSPSSAQTIAKSLLSRRMVALYPDSAVVTLSNELGETFESLVDGSFFAAAVSGAVVSPAVDVATPYTRRRIQGFTRIPRILDAVEANQTAVAGVTLLEDLDPVVRIRQGLTTDMSDLLTRLPTVTQISDHVSQQSRSVLDTFVGTKFLASRVNEVEVSMTALFKALVSQEIVAAFTGIKAALDPDDPTVLRAEAFYQPIFPLLYIILTFNLRARI